MRRCRIQVGKDSSGQVRIMNHETRQDRVCSLILGLSPCEAFASLYEKILIGLSAKETALILYPAVAANLNSPTLL